MTAATSAARTKTISPAAYGALSEVLAVIFWNKQALERYLRRALRDCPEILAGIDFTSPKRVVADEVIDRLMADEHRYRDASLRLMFEIAEMREFTNLTQQDDHEHLLRQARSAVAALGRFTAKHSAEREDHERRQCELAELRERAQARQNFAQALEALKAEFLGMTQASNAQKRGLDFESFLYRLFALFDLEPRLAYNLEFEQIDGSLRFDTDDYIIEAKWWQVPVERKDVSELASKVERKGKNTLGIFISVSGFSRGAIDAYREKTPFITIDGDDIFLVLDRRVQLDDLLKRKKRHASDTGSCSFPARMMLADS